MPGKGPGAAARRRSVSISVESVLEARIPLTTPRLVSRFLDERHSETPSSNSGAVVAAEFQELPDLQGLRSSLSCSPDLKSVSPPPSPHPSLPFSCPEIPEIHRSACPLSTHGAQTGRQDRKETNTPRPWLPLLSVGLTQALLGGGTWARGFWVLHALRKPQGKLVGNWALCPQGLAGGHRRSIWVLGVPGVFPGLPPHLRFQSCPKYLSRKNPASWRLPCVLSPKERPAPAALGWPLPDPRETP